MKLIANLNEKKYPRNEFRAIIMKNALRDNVIRYSDNFNNLYEQIQKGRKAPPTECKITSEKNPNKLPTQNEVYSHLAFSQLILDSTEELSNSEVIVEVD